MLVILVTIDQNKKQTILKISFLCSTKQRKSYRFGTALEWEKFLQTKQLGQCSPFEEIACLK